METPPSPTQASRDSTEARAAGMGPSVDSEITWLLHRAAQRMHAAIGEQVGKHGLRLRDYIVLSALSKTPNLTQAELGKALGLDKTTLMSQVDRLVRMGLVVRCSDPRDRRARISEITEAGDDLRVRVAKACAVVEAEALSGFGQNQVEVLRHILFDIIGDSEDRGSCL